MENSSFYIVIYTHGKCFFSVNVNNCGKYYFHFQQQFIVAESSTFHADHVGLFSALIM